MLGINKENNFVDSSQQVSMPPFQVSPHGTSDDPSLHIITTKWTEFS